MRVHLALLAALAVTIPLSHAIGGDVPRGPPGEAPEFTPGILGFDPAFFQDAGLSRYIVDGRGIAVLDDGAASGLARGGLGISPDHRLDFFSDAGEATGAVQVTGADEARRLYGADGNGTVVAIIDTGVDFSNPDMRHALARDANGHPVMLDPDGQGIVITNATFYADIRDGIIYNHEGPPPEGADSVVYVDRRGVFLDIERGGMNTRLDVYNSFYPNIGTEPVFEGILDRDMRIGRDSRDFISSESGIYRLGIIYQGGVSGRFTGIQTVPVLVVDSFRPGVYDTVVPDLSSAWLDYTRSQLPPGSVPPYDFDFTDEKPIVLGSGNEFLVYDSDGDGRDDFSAGTVGARVLDIYGVVGEEAPHDDLLGATGGTLLPALDPDGEFFGVMTDFEGHGTSSAAVIASIGKEEYPVYGKEEPLRLPGIAPGARILPVKTIWLGDIAYGWMWAAGFDRAAGAWEYTGQRSHIMSNSWGLSQFPSIGVLPGFDSVSLLHGALATPRSLDEAYPGVLMVTSSGNAGHGYGTIGPPGSSQFGITVGATTNNAFVGSEAFGDRPRFGAGTSHRDHVVDFSSRGPVAAGDAGPDLLSVGAFGFVPSSVLRAPGSDEEPYAMYGGTSMAAPAVAGAAALVMDGMSRLSQDVDPFHVQNVMMSTARHLGNDPFTQGAGLADAAAALGYVHGRNGTFAVWTGDTYRNLAGVLGPAADEADIPGAGPLLRPGSPPMAGWYAGMLEPGGSSTATFTISNPTSSEISVSVEPRQISEISRTEYSGTTKPRQVDPTSEEEGEFVANYVSLSDVREHGELADFFDPPDPVPDGSDLLVLGLRYGFSDFMNSTTEMYADDIGISSLYMYDWTDADNDTRIEWEEIELVSRAGVWGTVQELRISDPASRFSGEPLVGVYPVPTRYSYWVGDTGENSTAVDYVLSAAHYGEEPWDVAWVSSGTVRVPARGTAEVDVTVTAPSGAIPGPYQGFVVFEGDGHAARAPVSFGVAHPVERAGHLAEVPGAHGGLMYGAGYVRGAFDMSNRYMAGDWRQYYFDIRDPGIDTVAVEVSWEEDDTSHSVFVADPAGRIIQTSVPAGVFGQLEGWPSLDWLGPSGFSQGGGFYPAENKDERSTLLLVPVNGTGTHTLLTHSTLFAGASESEPVSISARFMALAETERAADPAGDPPGILGGAPVSDPAVDPVGDTSGDAAGPAAVPGPAAAPGDPAPVVSQDPGFLLGAAVGLAAGAAIGALAVASRRRARRPPRGDPPVYTRDGITRTPDVPLQ